MTSIYHILDKLPEIYSEDLSVEYESLAQELSNSGRLRIDTDYYCNFVHFSDNNSGVSLIFSYEELTDNLLVDRSRERLKSSYKNKKRVISDNKISLILVDLNKKASKLLLVSDELKLRLSRIFVQSAHPIVIKWLLLDKVEVFITYSHNIGDVMDIPTWTRSGSNSGMQSTDGRNVCIYVSCGGDPFANNDDTHPMYGNGWAALARMQIIAAQELGHYADIERDKNGTQITRHSTNFACTKAKENVKEARRSDIGRCNELYILLLKQGMDKLISIESKLKFYNNHKILNFTVLWLKIISKYYRRKILHFALKHKLIFIKRFYKREKYLGLMIKAMIEDMQSNLSPIADVYKRDNPDAEEAISCAEALARVPQQVMKWGYLTTRATMHDLYGIYYTQVITSLIESYESFTKTIYKVNHSKPKKSLIFKLKKSSQKHKFIEVRDI